APIVMVLALFSPQGLHGLYQQLFGRQRYTLVRDGIPPRPTSIRRYDPGSLDGPEDRPILEVRKLSRNFGAVVTAREINLQINARGLHSLIGPNGAGKIRSSTCSLACYRRAPAASISRGATSRELQFINGPASESDDRFRLFAFFPDCRRSK